MKHMASALVPGIYDPTLADENVWVSTEEAQEMARRLAREEGLFVGVSLRRKCPGGATARAVVACGVYGRDRSLR